MGGTKALRWKACDKRRAQNNTSGVAGWKARRTVVQNKAGEQKVSLKAAFCYPKNNGK